MPDRSNLNYIYDGSFGGLLCCVFASYESREIPNDIFPGETPQLTLMPAREIVTEPERAGRVRRGVLQKLGPNGLELLRRAFLTCLPQKELRILLFLRKGFRCGPELLRRPTDDTVEPLLRAVRHLDNESHLLKGFIRFSDYNGILAAKIEPKNFVLPLLAPHFCGRYPGSPFLIYDRTHEMVLLYRPNERPEILAAERVSFPRPGPEEERYRALWRAFYDAVEVPGRHNPKCRMSHMPKRYWNCMTEFDRA